MESIIRQKVQRTFQLNSQQSYLVRKATGDTLAEFRASNMDADFIKNWTTEWSNTMKWMVDNLSNSLIFFALPTAQYQNKTLLERFFDKHNCESIVLNVELFNILLNMDSMSIRERPIPKAIVTAVTTSGTTFGDTVHIPKDSKLPKTPTATSSWGTPIGHLEQPTPTSSSLLTKCKHVTLDTPIVSSGRDVVIVNTAAKPSFAHKSSISSSSSSKTKRTTDKSKITCRFDDRGCTKEGCPYVHIKSLTMYCHDIPIGKDYTGCCGSLCKFRHRSLHSRNKPIVRVSTPLPATPPPSPPPLIQSEGPTSARPASKSKYGKWQHGPSQVSTLITKTNQPTPII